jgi:hypothetical protein
MSAGKVMIVRDLRLLVGRGHGLLERNINATPFFRAHTVAFNHANVMMRR